MLGILVQLTLSWLIIWLYNRKGLSVLGFGITGKRFFYFLLLFLVTAGFCASGFLLKMYLGHQSWQLNPALSLKLVWDGFWWNLKSVLFEELIFRGVLLYILLDKIGTTKAILVSAAAFGIYHWFSFGVLGNPLQMIIVFLMTGTMGLLLAYAFSKSRSLYLPIGIHLGWNFTQIFVFSNGPIGKGIFIPVGDASFRTDSMLLFIAVTFLPVVLMLLVDFLIVKRLKPHV
ncbi:MAG: CPBP family intramembrane metalloprotease [Bacteroidota bacterium]|nr:CPBP family intramembrane metalloprotease [Bacteroidota bacterium]